MQLDTISLSRISELPRGLERRSDAYAGSVEITVESIISHVQRLVLFDTDYSSLYHQILPVCTLASTLIIETSVEFKLECAYPDRVSPSVCFHMEQF